MTNRDAMLEHLIKTEWPNLRRFFRTKVPEGEVLDLVQATMLAYVEGDGPKEAGKEKQYLMGIARFQLLKYYDSKHRRAGEAFNSELHRVTDLGPSLSSKLDSRNRVVAALQTLTADEQMAVELRHGEDMKIDEIAEAMGKSPATVKRYIASGEEKLRAQLGDMSSVSEAYKNL